MPKKSKNYKGAQPQSFKGERITFVKKANMQCRTSFEGGKQKVEWLK